MWFVEPLKLNTKLDRTFTNEKQKVSYPFIFLPRYGEELPVVVRCLRSGALPIVLDNKGILVQVGTCDLSALELMKLLGIYSFEVVLSVKERYPVANTKDMLEVIPWMASSLSSSQSSYSSCTDRPE